MESVEIPNDGPRPDPAALVPKQIMTDTTPPLEPIRSN
jgi:hypothetical protein